MDHGVICLGYGVCLSVFLSPQLSDARRSPVKVARPKHSLSSHKQRRMIDWESLLPRDAMLARYSLSFVMSLCVSVTRRYCAKLLI